MRAHVALALAIAATIAGLAACAPKADIAGCAPADEDVIEAIQGKVADGTLQFGGTATSDEGRVFVSAHLDPRDEDEDDDKILTWLATGAGAFESVDEQARNHSSWPEATIDVRTDGARTSRACVADYRAKASTTTTP